MLFVHVSRELGTRELGSREGGWMPLPTRPQRYCDPASLVTIITWCKYLTLGFPPNIKMTVCRIIIITKHCKQGNEFVFRHETITFVSVVNINIAYHSISQRYFLLENI